MTDAGRGAPDRLLDRRYDRRRASFDTRSLGTGAPDRQDRTMSSVDLAPQRILLVPQRRDTPARRDAGAPPIRRYRLARVQVNARTPAARSARLAHLRRRYD